MSKNIFLIELSESERADFGKIDFDQQSDPQKVFSAIWELEGQVNNGGFEQYFRNCETEVIAYAPTALRAIGAVACAGIVDGAITLIAPMPATRDSRDVALDALHDDAQERLMWLDAEFLGYPDNLTDLLFDFVRRHPEQFGPVPVELRPA